MDNADGGQARAVMDKYSAIDGNSVTFCMTRVFIEAVSLTLAEEGSSVDLVNQHIAAGMLFINVVGYTVFYVYSVLVYLFVAVKANPFVIWVITYAHLFDELQDNIDYLMTTQGNESSESTSSSDHDVSKNRVEFSSDSLEEALIYCRIDYDLWYELDGSLDLLASYINEHKLKPPRAVLKENNEVPLDTGILQSSDVAGKSVGSAVAGCYALYNTAVELICKELA